MRKRSQESRGSGRDRKYSKDSKDSRPRSKGSRHNSRDRRSPPKGSPRASPKNTVENGSIPTDKEVRLAQVETQEKVAAQVSGEADPSAH